MTEQTHGTPPFLMRCLSADEWQAYVASYDFGTIPPSRIVMHHTWKPTLADWQGEASMRGMQSYYASLGWSAAPHLYVAPDGIWLATPMREVGVHAGIGNSGWWHGTWSYSIGVEMVGNYDRQRPSGDVWRLTKDVLGGLAKRLDRAPQELIFFHRDFADKTCPGRAVPKTWVWTEVETWLEAQQPPVQEPQVHEAFRTAWEASGGIWQPEQLMPGYPIAPAEVGADGRLQQRFERGIAVQIKGITHWRLISEVFADYAASNAPEPVTAHRPILAKPRATARQAQNAIVQRGTTYTDDEVETIVGHYWTLCPEVGVDPLIAIAQCIHETDNTHKLVVATAQKKPRWHWRDRGANNVSAG